MSIIGIKYNVIACPMCQKQCHYPNHYVNPIRYKRLLWSDGVVTSSLLNEQPIYKRYKQCPWCKAYFNFTAVKVTSGFQSGLLGDMPSDIISRDLESFKIDYSIIINEKDFSELSIEKELLVRLNFNQAFNDEFRENGSTENTGQFMENAKRLIELIESNIVDEPNMLMTLSEIYRRLQNFEKADQVIKFLDANFETTNHRLLQQKYLIHRLINANNSDLESTNWRVYE